MSWEAVVNFLENRLRLNIQLEIPNTVPFEGRVVMGKGAIQITTLDYPQATYRQRKAYKNQE